MTTAVIVELYRGPAPDTAGTEMRLDHRLDTETLMWLAEQGWGQDSDLWVNLVRPDEWAPNNRPIAVTAARLLAGELDPEPGGDPAG